MINGLHADPIPLCGPTKWCTMGPSCDHPQRNTRGLDWLGEQGDLLDGVVLARKGKGGLSPQPCQDRKPLIELLGPNRFGTGLSKGGKIALRVP